MWPTPARDCQNSQEAQAPPPPVNTRASASLPVYVSMCVTNSDIMDLGMVTMRTDVLVFGGPNDTEPFTSTTVSLTAIWLRSGMMCLRLRAATSPARRPPTHAVGDLPGCLFPSL